MSVMVHVHFQESPQVFSRADSYVVDPVSGFLEVRENDSRVATFRDWGSVAVISDEDMKAVPGHG